MNRQDLDYQQDNEQQSGNEKWLERFYEILSKWYEFILDSDKEFFANELFDIAKEYAATQNNNVEDKWISVEDELPEEGGRYWCYVEHQTDLGLSHFQWNCSYNETTKTFSDRYLTDGERVTHWQPLPPTPTK